MTNERNRPASERNHQTGDAGNAKEPLTLASLRPKLEQEFLPPARVARS